MTRKRIQCFVDGFNLYHAVDKLGDDYLKWYDLNALVSHFIDPTIQEITDVFYFSAYANWLPSAVSRHKEYVTAITAMGCQPVMGVFKEKDRRCRSCKTSWKAHEEKETDVNIALWLIRGAFKNEYDEAFVVSRDSDLTPAIKMVLREFPKKSIKLISPPNAGHSKQMGGIVGKNKLASIKRIHLERSLLPTNVKDPNTGIIVAKRPTKYAVPI